MFLYSAITKIPLTFHSLHTFSVASLTSGLVIFCLHKSSVRMIYCHVGSRCGLVALCMAAEMLGVREQPLNTNIALETAVKKGFTNHGEMFSGVSKD